MKRILSAFLALVMVFCLLPISASAATEYNGQTASGDYSISTAAQLAQLATAVNSGTTYESSTFTLANDIDLSTVCGAGVGSWTPIGYPTDGTRPFQGVFDGNGHTVSHMYADTSTTGSASGNALFGYIGASGMVKNLGIANSTISGKDNYIGGIAVYNYGTISSCFSGVDLSSSLSSTNPTNAQYAGGISSVNNGTISKCYFYGTISVAGNGRRIGGISGLSSGNFYDCYSRGSISVSGTKTEVAAVVGRFNSGFAKERCYYTSSCNVSDSNATLKDDKADLLGSLISAGFAADVNNINDGWPVLEWQNPSAPNSAPVILAANPGTAATRVNSAYSVSLSTVFFDAESDPLTYTVSVNGAYTVSAATNYIFTPPAAGAYSLVFKASDGKLESPAYTLNLTAVDDSGLKAAIDAAPASGYFTSGDRYNGKTTSVNGFWADMQAVLKTANSVYSNSASTQLLVDNSTYALNASVSLLIPLSRVNATVLYEAINDKPFIYGENEVKIYTDASYYSYSSWNAYQSALTASKNMLSSLYDSGGSPTALNKASYQASVNDQAAALAAARNSLDRRADEYGLADAQSAYDGISVLANKLFKPANMNASNYTAQSWADFIAVRDEALAWCASHGRPNFNIGKNEAKECIAVYNKLWDACYKGLSPSAGSISVSVTVSDAYAAKKNISPVDIVGTRRLTLSGGSTIKDALGFGYGALESRIDSGRISDCRIGVYLNGVFLLNPATGGVSPPESLNFDDVKLHDGDELLVVYMAVPTYYNLSGALTCYGVSEVGSYVRYLEASQKELSAEAGKAFSMTVLAQSALPSKYSGEKSAVSGASVFVSDCCQTEAAARSAAAVKNSGAVSGSDGGFTLKLYSEGWYALSILENGDYGGISCGSTVIVHITASSNPAAVKAELQAELDAAYASCDKDYFSADNWNSIQNSYDSGTSGIKDAATLGEAADAQKTAIKAIKAIYDATTSENTKKIASFRTLLNELPDNTSLIDKSLQGKVDALILTYGAMSEYQISQLNGIEQNKYKAIVAANQAGLPEAVNYTLRFQVVGDTEEATAALQSMYAYLREHPASEDKITDTTGGAQLKPLGTFNSSGLTETTSTALKSVGLTASVDYASYYQVRDAQDHVLTNGGSWRITHEGFSFSQITESGCKSGKARVYVGGTAYEVKEYHIEGLNEASIGWSALTQFNKSSYLGLSKDCVNLTFDNAVMGFNMPFNNVSITAVWGPVMTESDLNSAKSASSASLTSAYSTYDSANYTESNWAALTAAYNSGLANIANATTFYGAAAARKEAMAAMAAVPTKETQGAPNDFGSAVGKVYITVENTTFTSPANGDTPGWTGTLLSGWYNLYEKDTMMTCVLRALEAKGCTWTGTGSSDKYGITYLSSITKPGGGKLGEFDGYSGSGWMGTLNDWFVNEGFQQFSVKGGNLESGDYIRIMFTTNLGADIGGTWGSADTSLSSLTVSSGTLMPAFKSERLSYGLLISGPSQSVKITPEANNKNYLVKAFLNRYNDDSAYYKRTEAINVQPGDIIYVGCGEREWPSMNNQETEAIDYTGTKYTIKVYNSKADFAKDLIDALPAVSNVTFSNYTSYKDEIEYAREIYESLTSPQKSEVANLASLTAAEDRLKFYEDIADVKKLLAAIPKASTITSSNMSDVAKQVLAVDAAYKALSEEQKLYITVAIVTNYNNAIKALNELGAFASGSAPSAISGSNNAPESSGGAVKLTPDAAVSGGKASVSVSASAITAAIKSAKTSGSDTIVIAPKVSGTVTKTSVEIPKGSISSIASDTSAVLKVETPVGSVSIPNEALLSISNQAAGSTVTVSLNTVEAAALTEAQKSAVGSSTVYDISIMSGGSHISSFGEGSITVSLPYTLKDGESESSVKVWYLNDSGELQQISCSYDKSTGLATFTTTHLSYYIVGSSADWTNPFADVREGDWFFKAVGYVSQKGLMSGTSEKSFEPNANMTRAMVVTVLYRLEGKPAAYPAGTFADVEDGKWYTDAVKWATANGIVSGYGGGVFGTDDSVTREQLATILYNYAKHKGYGVTKSADLGAYSDAQDISAWANYAMKWAVAEGLMNGTTDATLEPSATATRAQVATILMRFAEKNK